MWKQCENQKQQKNVWFTRHDHLWLSPSDNPQDVLIVVIGLNIKIKSDTPPVCGCQDWQVGKANLLDCFGRIS